MARRRFKCSKCDRRFSMAAHLARHVNAIHKRKAGGSAAGKKRTKVRRKVGRPKAASAKVGHVRGRRGGPAQARLLAQMRTVIGELAARREALDDQIAALSAAMDTLKSTK